jgi:ABC-type multidrug transport system permease subunit
MIVFKSVCFVLFAAIGIYLGIKVAKRKKKKK